MENLMDRMIENDNELFKMWLEALDNGDFDKADRISYIRTGYGYAIAASIGINLKDLVMQVINRD